MRVGKNKAFSFGEYAALVLGFDVILIVLVGYPILQNYGITYLTSGIAGLLITSFNFVASYYVIEKFSDRPGAVFINVIIGSMVVRLMLLMVIIIAVVLLVNIDRFSFIISLFISYIYKSVIEIYFIHKKSRIKGLEAISD